jgi:UDP-N-acetylmuramate-alanine ligase
VALVNNAQREHQEFMASVEAVARENGAVIEALPPLGIAVFPADDDHAPLWRRLAGARPVLTFALEGPADVTAEAAWAADRWSQMLQTPAQRQECARGHRLRAGGRLSARGRRTRAGGLRAGEGPLAGPHVPPRRP